MPVSLCYCIKSSKTLHIINEIDLVVFSHLPSTLLIVESLDISPQVPRVWRPSLNHEESGS